MEDYIKKLSGVESLIEDTVKSARAKIEEAIEEINNNRNKLSKRIEELVKEEAKLQIRINEARKEAQRRAHNFAESESSQMRQKDLDDYYWGSRQSAYNKIYDNKLEEYMNEEAEPLRRKLMDVQSELNATMRKEIDDNIKKKTDEILRAAKADLVSALAHTYDIKGTGFIDFEKMVNMDGGHLKYYVKWIAYELVERPEIQAQGDFVKLFNEIYEEQPDIAMMISEEDGFIDRYVNDISDVSEPTTLDVLRKYGYEGPFATKEIEIAYRYECELAKKNAQIRSLSDTVATQEGQIENLNTESGEKNTELEQKNAEIDKKNEENQALQEKLSEAESTINEKDRVITETQAELQAEREKNEAQAKEQSDIITAKEAEIAELNAKIERLKEEKAAEEKKSANLEKRVEMQDELIKYDSKIIKKLRKSVEILQSKIQEYSRWFTGLKDQANDIVHRVNEHKNHLENEKSKGFFRKLKDLIFGNKKDDDKLYAEESATITEMCKNQEENATASYVESRKDCMTMSNYQVPDSWMQSRDRIIRGIDGNVEVSFEVLELNDHDEQ